MRAPERRGGRRGGTTWVALLAGLAPLASATRAGAQGLDRMEVSGDCPGPALVAAAFAERALPDDARAFALGVRGFAGGADVTLTNASGTTVIERRLVSDDCAAMADAAAEIVSAYFVALARGDATSAAGPDLEAAIPPENPRVPTPPPLPPPPPAAPPPRAADTAPALAPTRPPSGWAPRFVAVLTGGVDVFPQGPNAAATAALGFGVGVTRRLELGVRAVIGSSTTIGVPPDRVLRAERRLTARATTWLSTSPRLAVVGGVGVASTRVRAENLDTTPVEIVWSPVLEGGVALAVPLGAGFSLQAELGCHALFLRENYVVNGTESIGQGPAFGCSLAAGPAWSTPSK